MKILLFCLAVTLGCQSSSRHSPSEPLPETTRSPQPSSPVPIEAIYIVGNPDLQKLNQLNLAEDTEDGGAGASYQTALAMTAGVALTLVTAYLAARHVTKPRPASSRPRVDNTAPPPAPDSVAPPAVPTPEPTPAAATAAATHSVPATSEPPPGPAPAATAAAATHSVPTPEPTPAAAAAAATHSVPTPETHASVPTRPASTRLRVDNIEAPPVPHSVPITEPTPAATAAEAPDSMPTPPIISVADPNELPKNLSPRRGSIAVFSDLRDTGSALSTRTPPPVAVTQIGKSVHMLALDPRIEKVKPSVLTHYLGIRKWGDTITYSRGENTPQFLGGNPKKIKIWGETLKAGDRFWIRDSHLSETPEFYKLDSEITEAFLTNHIIQENDSFVLPTSETHPSQVTWQGATWYIRESKHDISVEGNPNFKAYILTTIADV